MLNLTRKRPLEGLGLDVGSTLEQAKVMGVNTKNWINSAHVEIILDPL